MDQVQQTLCQPWRKRTTVNRLRPASPPWRAAIVDAVHAVMCEVPLARIDLAARRNGITAAPRAGARALIGFCARAHVIEAQSCDGTKIAATPDRSPRSPSTALRVQASTTRHRPKRVPRGANPEQAGAASHRSVSDGTPVAAQARSARAIAHPLRATIVGVSLTWTSTSIRS